VWREAPWLLLLVAAAIAGLGVWNLTSAARTAQPLLWKSQLWWLLIGLAACVAMMVFDYRHLLRLAYPVYGFVLLLLLAVRIKGHAAMGAQRWLDFGPVHLQPSELMKIAIILVLARFYHEDPRHKEGYSLWDLWLPAILVLVPVVLVLKQPDLGTALMITAVAGTLILFGKLRLWTLILCAVLGVAGAGLAWGYIATCDAARWPVVVWSPGAFPLEGLFKPVVEAEYPDAPRAVRPTEAEVRAGAAARVGPFYCMALKRYQFKRVTSFMDPEADMLGSGYHASQSLIAVGGGQGWGKGWGEGTQTQLSFLPEQHTDFIFSVWGEEHGFFGASMLVLLYLLLLLLSIGVAVGAREKFGCFIAVGVSALLFWQVFVNIGMVTGLLPVVGVTLPLMSYGGSSVLTILVALGLSMNVGMRRNLF
jgi:rod shape determining protein RodA